MALDFDAIRRKLDKLSGNNTSRNVMWKPEEGQEYKVRLLSFPDNDGQPFGNPPSGNDQPLTEATGSGCAHAHTIMPHNNIPEYFALAFIIYVGVE